MWKDSSIVTMISCSMISLSSCLNANICSYQNSSQKEIPSSCPRNAHQRLGVSSRYPDIYLGNFMMDTQKIEKLTIFSYLLTIEIIDEKFVIIIRSLPKWMIKLSDFLKSYIEIYRKEVIYVMWDTFFGGYEVGLLRKLWK